MTATIIPIRPDITPPPALAPGASSLPIQVSWFTNAFDAKDPIAKSQTYSWPEFIADLQSRLSASATSKDQLPMFVAALWKGSTRSKASVAALTLGVLDVDGIPQADLDRVCQALTPFQAAIYTSPSDPLPDGRRKVRIIVTVDQAVAPEDSRRLRTGLATALQVHSDPSTVDASRGFFAGHIGNGPRHLWISPGTAPVNARALIEAVPRLPERTAGASELPDTGGEADVFVGQIPQPVQAVLAETLSTLMVAGQKNQLLYSLGGLLRQWGWSVQDTAELARLTLELRSSTHGDVADQAAGVDTIVRGYFVDNKHGWGKVNELLGPEIAETLALHAPSISNTMRKVMTAVEASPFWQEQQRLSDAQLAERSAAQQAASTDGPTNTLPTSEAELLASVGREISLEHDIPLPEYVIDNLPWHMGAVNTLLSAPGGGKSPNFAVLAASLASGKPYHGSAVLKPGRVLVLAFEAPLTTASLIQRAARGMGAQDCMARIKCLEVTPGMLADPQAFARVVELAKLFEHMIIDTYSSAVDGDWEDSSFASVLKRLEVPGHGVFVAMHAVKEVDKLGGDFKAHHLAGTNMLRGATKAIVGVRHVDKERDPYHMRMWCIRSPDRQCEPFEFRLLDVSERDVDSPLGEGFVNPKWGLRSEPVQQKDEVLIVEDSREIAPHIVKAAIQILTDTFASEDQSVDRYRYRLDFTALERKLGLLGYGKQQIEDALLTRIYFAGAGYANVPAHQAPPSQVQPFVGTRGVKKEIMNIGLREPTPLTPFPGADVTGSREGPPVVPPRLPNVPGLPAYAAPGPASLPLESQPTNDDRIRHQLAQNSQQGGRERMPLGEFMEQVGLALPSEHDGKRRGELYTQLERIGAELFGAGFQVKRANGAREPATLTIPPIS